MGNVPGLGPSYWTKLLYFFSPTKDFYIMDQWTGKSVNLLTGLHVVRLEGNATSQLNKCGNYRAYCEEIDAMAMSLSHAGENIEEMLMSKGGRNPWQWRAHVRTQYDYNSARMHAAYPHIPNGDF